MVFLPSINAFAIPVDENSAILKSWVLPIPAYEHNRFFAIASTFSGNNVYFTESSSNKIGKLDPATNTITEWNIPTNSSMPVSIKFDSSTGNVYFTESSSNKIGRLVPINNEFTEWSLQEEPVVINVDSAGSIHFIDNNGTRIYRLG